MSYSITFYNLTAEWTDTRDGYPYFDGWDSFGSLVDSTQTVTFNDDDPNFDNSYFDGPDSGQAVTSDVTLGGELVTAGTVLTTPRATQIQDSDGNLYHAFFPFHVAAQSTVPSDIVGDQYVIGVIPVGDSPPFDPNKNYMIDNTVGNQGYLFTNYHATLTPPDSVTCFANGTIIDTQLGPRRIEDLSPGDMIRTRDHGMRRLQWVGCTHVDAARLDLAPNLRPIHIRAGALGPKQPRCDLTVSPQHRVLLRSNIARRLFGQDEVLVAAKHLIALDGIEIRNPAEGVTYWHMLFDEHELVWSEGCWTESLYTGPQALKSIPRAAKREIAALFPALFSPGAAAPEGARPFLSGRQGRNLAQRHARNGKPLVNA